MSEDVSKSLSGLSLSTATPSILESTLLSYSAWIIKPTSDLLNPTSILDGRVHLYKYIKPNIAISQLPIIKDPMPLPITIQPYTDIVEPVPIPNLVLMLASLFSLDHVADRRSAWQTLSSYDILMPRKVLIAILGGQFDQIELYAWRPSPGAPIFIDRMASYSTNPGSIGNQFADRIVEKRADYFRFYGVSEVVLDGRLNIVVTGEIDAVDEESGAPIEIKTKPSWAKPIAGRDMDNWLQAMIGSVQKIMTAGFTAERGSRNGPVSFSSCNVVWKTPDEFYRPGRAERQRLEAGVKFLDAIMNGCTSSEKVYKVKGDAYGLPYMILEDDISHCTVNKKLIEYVATMNWT